MKRATVLTLVMAAAFFQGVTAASAAEAAEQPEAAAPEVDGGLRGGIASPSLLTEISTS
jgi:hypothetical protein